MNLPTLRVLLLLAVAACSAGATAGAPNPPDGPSLAPTGDEAGTPVAASDGGGPGPGDGSPTADAALPGDDVALSFVFVGCNRISKKDWDPAANPSAANVPQLQQTLSDIAAMPRTPKLVFFTGDLVLGLNKDSTLLAGQLNAWSQLYKAHPVSAKVDLVPMPGNHEMLYKDKTSGLEFSSAPSDAIWTQWLTASDFGAKAGNGPTTAAPNADALQDDQSKLSYSFDSGAVHFVVLNTDTWTTTSSGTATELGWIALHWLTTDLAAAQANPQITSIFVLGHKPVVNPNGSTLADDAINPALTAGVVAALDGTPKVRAYLAAHSHEWDARKLTGSRAIYQVIAGNGGSALEADWTVPTPYYGFSEALLYKSGRVAVVSHQRPVPAPYNSPTVVAAAPAPELTIAP
jgi:hypothetical protein